MQKDSKHKKQIITTTYATERDTIISCKHKKYNKIVTNWNMNTPLIWPTFTRSLVHSTQILYKNVNQSQRRMERVTESIQRYVMYIADSLLIVHWDRSLGHSP